MTFPLVRDPAADGIPVTMACGVLGFSRQAYYAWLADPVSDRDWDDAHAVHALRQAHAYDPFADQLRLHLDEVTGPA